MVRANFSKEYWAIRKRIQRLPRLFEKTADTITRKDADGFVDTYKEGIRKNNFGLVPLKKESEAQKRQKGYSKPGTPLYGAGDSVKNSYINALRIRKIKKGYRVFISKAKHHSANLPLNVLFEIHEKGALIRMMPKTKGFFRKLGVFFGVIERKVTIIRIPPRPTRKKAFKRFLTKRLREEKAEEVRKAIINYLKFGDVKGLK